MFCRSWTVTRCRGLIKAGQVELLGCQLHSPAVQRRGGRVVEGAALEMLYRGNSIEGSNPSLSVPHQAALMQPKSWQWTISTTVDGSDGSPSRGVRDARCGRWPVDSIRGWRAESSSHGTDPDYGVEHSWAHHNLGDSGISIDCCRSEGALFACCRKWHQCWIP